MTVSKMAPPIMNTKENEKTRLCRIFLPDGRHLAKIYRQTKASRKNYFKSRKFCWRSAS